MTEPRRILVIKLSALGDMVLALAACARIRAAHPAAHITLLTTPPYEPLARASPWFNEVETDGRPRSLAGVLALIRRLRKARYDRVYDLQANDRTNAYFQALRPFPPPWSGTAFGCSLPHRNPARMRLHSLEREADQLRDAGIWPDAPTAPGSAPGPDVSWLLGPLDLTMPDLRPLALLTPGASPRRPLKLWPAANYGVLAGGLMAAGFDVAIVGGASEGALAAVIREAAPGARDLTGQTDFPTIARLGVQARVAVGNDTGPLHLIAAAGAPTLALFSHDSDPALCAPRGQVRTLRVADLSELDTKTVLREALSLAAPRSTLMS